jgi:hypothetical protein
MNPETPNQVQQRTAPHVMNNRTAQKLIRTNAVAAGLCILFTLWLALTIPNARTMWSNPAWATERIEHAQTMEQMRQLLQSCALGMAHSESTYTILWRIVLIALLLICALLVSNALHLRKLIFNPPPSSQSDAPSKQ